MSVYATSDRVKGAAPGLTDIRRALSDPVRLRILEALWEGPKTAKALATSVGALPNRLYYHLRALEASGVIGVVGTEVVGRFAERVYGARFFGFGAELPGIDPADRAALYSAMFEATAAEIATAAEAGAPIHDVFRGLICTTPKRFAELVEAVGELLERARAEDSDFGTDTYRVSFAAYQMPDAALASE